MSDQLSSYGHNRLKQGGKATIIIVVAVVVIVLLCACAAIAATVLLGPTIIELLSKLFVPA